MQTDEESLFGRLDVSSLIPGNVDEDILKNDLLYQDLLSELRDLKENNGNIDDLSILMNKLEVHKKVLYALHGNKPKLVTMGKIPDSQIVFLDEIFKCNYGTLNSLLTALNEKHFTNEGETITIDIISFFAASNETPDFTNPENIIILALFDRFDLKVVTDYIQDRDNLLRILSREQQTQIEETMIDLKELNEMQNEVARVNIPEDIKKLMIGIAYELRDDYKLHISDRKIINYFPIAQAKAWLSGRDTVEVSDLRTMKHCFWTVREDISKIQEVLEKYCITPSQKNLKKIMFMADESYDDFTANMDANPANAAIAIVKLREEFKRISDMIKEIEAETSDKEDTYAINKAKDALEEIFMQAHKRAKIAYIPLFEI